MKTNNNDIARGVSKHIRYGRDAKGRRKTKTVCTSHVLAYLGIDQSEYLYSGYVDQRVAILRKKGFSVRSRLSAVKRAVTSLTVNQVSEAVRLYSKDPPGTHYMVQVHGHALLLDERGDVVVDTDPRVGSDRRNVKTIYAVYKETT